MEFKPFNRPVRQLAFTLPELMVSIAIGSIVLLFAGSFYLFSMRSFTALANYVDLSSRSRTASDWISRDVRSALSVQSLVNDQLILNEPGGTNVTYTYSAVSGKLVRADGTRTQVLLMGITPNSFAFYFYGRPTNATPVFEDFPTNAPSSAKLVGFKWACTRTVMVGAQATSDSLQTAVVNLRNQ
jgi:prepilin-type N-terminal cleavage/methylation domain-containing protein